MLGMKPFGSLWRGVSSLSTFSSFSLAMTQMLLARWRTPASCSEDGSQVQDS
jgi:hypothetical protein